MILNALVYTVVEKVSFWDEILNILTALGTVGAVILSLYFSSEEKRAKKAEEAREDEIIKEVIHTSLNNSLHRMSKYREALDNALLEEDGDIISLEYYDGSELITIYHDSYVIVSDHLDSNLDKDILFISTQLSVLKELGIKSITLKWIKTYYQVKSDLYLLENSLKEMRSNRSVGIRNNYFFENINDILSPIEELSEDLKNK